ncbi:hypothetical protein E4U47_000462 [Claviceps purpurea]|nr:hypothetical protein E4U36_003267 [Claviceps purpurea]KAG6275895.1 hypothetical protein E4U47_000462 [Claviceps purpurea]
MSGDDNVRREAELWALHARAQAAEERALEAERQHDAVVDYAREELRLRQAEQRERRLTLAGLLHAYHTIDKLKTYFWGRFVRTRRLRETFDIAADGMVYFDDSEKKISANVTIRERSKTKTSHPVNQWCEYKAPGVEEKLVLPVLYESPRWLPPHQMQIGLDGVNAIKLSHIMNPSHPAGDHITSEARRLAAAVITQLFDMMTKQEVRFGYVDTGRFKIFIRVGDDPACVEYHLALPSDDVEGEGQGDAEPAPRLHLTSVGQVFAFALLAVKSPALLQDWIDKSRAPGI